MDLKKNCKFFTSILKLVYPGLCILILIPILVGTSPVKAEPSSRVTISFIDVGQGDATLIRDGNDFDILIDGGKDYMGERVLDYLRQHQVDDIEIMLATHADQDHIGGLIPIIQSEEIPVENIYYNGYPGDTLIWSKFEEAVISEGLSLHSAQYPSTFSWGEFKVSVLNPIHGIIDPAQNDVSIVLLISFDRVSLLLTGDIDSGVEALLPARTSDLNAEILKIAHHGSKFSTSETFLDQVQAEEAVISVGSNPYGHPSVQVLSRLNDFGARIWRTDYRGTIQVLSDGISYTMLPRIVYLPMSFRLFLLNDYLK